MVWPFSQASGGYLRLRLGGFYRLVTLVTPHAQAISANEDLRFPQFTPISAYASHNGVHCFSTEWELML